MKAKFSVSTFLAPSRSDDICKEDNSISGTQSELLLNLTSNEIRIKEKQSYYSSCSMHINWSFLLAQRFTFKENDESFCCYERRTVRANSGFDVVRGNECIDRDVILKSLLFLFCRIMLGGNGFGKCDIYWSRNEIWCNFQQSAAVYGMLFHEVR